VRKEERQNLEWKGEEGRERLPCGQPGDQADAFSFLKTEDHT
jgi:hypothetical protein